MNTSTPTRLGPMQSLRMALPGRPSVAPAHPDVERSGDSDLAAGMGTSDCPATRVPGGEKHPCTQVRP